MVELVNLYKTSVQSQAANLSFSFMSVEIQFKQELLGSSIFQKI